MEERLFVENGTKRVVIGGTKAKLQLPSLHTKDVVIVAEALDRSKVLVFDKKEFAERFEPWEEHSFNHSESVVKEASFVFKYFRPFQWSGPLYCDGAKLESLLREYGMPDSWLIGWQVIDEVSPKGYTRQVSMQIEVTSK